MKNLFKARKGNIISNIGAMAIGIAITILVTSTVFNSISTTGFSNATNASYNATVSNTWTSFTLLGILLIVVAAAAMTRVFGQGGE
jgi:ABC-type nickel/cobalt efflux system permease component RcnA